jgi:replicative DNA helicase
MKPAAKKKPIPSSSVDAGLPCSIEAEETLLGSVLLEPSVMTETDDLFVDDFYLDAHRHIFTGMRALYQKDVAIDTVTLSEWLSEKRLLNAAGGVAYLSKLIVGVPHAPSAKQYIEIVREKSRLRRLIHAANGAVTRAMEGCSSEELVTHLEEQILEVSGETANEKAVHISTVAPAIVERFRNQIESGTSIVGVRTGIEPLDITLGGIRGGEIVVVAAKPGFGKSAFMLNVAAHNAKVDGVKTGIFSLEMSKEQLYTRLISTDAKIDNTRVRSAYDMDMLEREDAAKALERIAGWPLWVDDSGGLNVAQIVSRAKLMYAKGVRLFFVDYLQKVAISAEAKDVRHGINEICDALRVFAKRYNVPVVELSQLKRYPEDREPDMSDLKESGNIEQDAHIVLLLHRDVDEKGDFSGLDKIKIGKNREGPTGYVRAEYVGEFLEWRGRKKQESKAVVEKQEKKNGATDSLDAKGAAAGVGGDTDLFGRADSGSLS